MKPMLAITGDINNLSPSKGSPLIIQPKLDGVRAMWCTESQQLKTRNGRVITCVPHINKAIIDQGIYHLPLDGELYMHETPLSTIAGMVRCKRYTEAHNDLGFYIFDLRVPNLSTVKRLDLLNSRQMTTPLSAMHTVSVTDHKKLIWHHETHLRMGCEGSIIRTPNSEYIPRRSKDLVKIKPIQDMEGVLTGFNESTGTSIFRSLRLQIIVNGKKKQISCPVMSEKKKEEIYVNYAVGDVVTFEYAGQSASGTPQQPRIKSIRHDL